LRKDFIAVQAEGYSPLDAIAERIAAARHLLEIVYRRPVLVKPLRLARVKAPKAKSKSEKQKA
jgi:hypothetical protein